MGVWRDGPGSSVNLFLCLCYSCGLPAERRQRETQQHPSPLSSTSPSSYVVRAFRYRGGAWGGRAPRVGRKYSDRRCWKVTTAPQRWTHVTPSSEESKQFPARTSIRSSFCQLLFKKEKEKTIYSLIFFHFNSHAVCNVWTVDLTREQKAVFFLIFLELFWVEKRLLMSSTVSYLAPE